MVRNCLRVLKHHEVISMVDMFFYTNRYESTERAASMLAGQEPSLLHEAAEYVLKVSREKSGIHFQSTAPTPYSNLMASASSPTASPTLQERYVRPHTPVTPVGVHPGTSPVSPIPSSFPPNDQAAALSSSLLGSSLKYATYASYHSHEAHIFGALRREEQRELKMALAELYTAFNRNVNFGDVWVALATGQSRSRSMDRSTKRNETSGNTSLRCRRTPMPDRERGNRPTSSPGPTEDWCAEDLPGIRKAAWKHGIASQGPSWQGRNLPLL